MATNGSSAADLRPVNGHRSECSLQSIIDEFLSFPLSLKGYNWTPNETKGVPNDSHLNYSLSASQRTEIVDSLKALGRQYVHLYEGQLSAMCDRLEVSPSSAFSTFNSVSNELFIEGIKWNHIITYLVFGSQFAFTCVQNGFPTLVNEVSHWISSYIEHNLSQWIADNGGLEYVIEFAGDKIGRREGDGHTKLIYGAAGAIGALTLGLFLRNFSFFK